MIQQLLENFNPLDIIGLWLLIAFLIAFLVCYMVLPTLIHVAEVKHLLDEPDERSTHSRSTPTLGGIGIYLSMVVVITTIGALLDAEIMLLILGGMTLLFFLGLKDDLLILSPRKKFIGQLIAALLLIIFTDTRIVGFSGLFGVTILPYVVSVVLTLFIYILIINAYNLVDGVDGLAGTLGLFCTAVFVYIFVQNKDVSIATIAIGLVGALIPFLRLNFSKKRKLFMGDTGSMIIGFLIAFFCVRFLNQSQVNVFSLFHKSAPVLAVSIVFFPLLDTARVFIIRIFIHKTSPFIADKNHIHHRFLKLGFSHIKTTTIVVAINALLVLFAFFIRPLDIHFQFGLVIFLGCFMYFIFYVFYLSLQKSSLKSDITVKSQS